MTITPANAIIIKDEALYCRNCDQMMQRMDDCFDKLGSLFMCTSCGMGINPPEIREALERGATTIPRFLGGEDEELAAAGKELPTPPLARMAKARARELMKKGVKSSRGESSR